MRARSTCLVVLLGLLIGACSDGADAPADAAGPTLLPPSNGQAPAGQGGAGGGKPAVGGGAQPDAVYAEVVYVLLQTNEGGTGFCTGTLVAKDVVITAAHCLDPGVFAGFEVVAPLAPGKPRVSASRAAAFEGNYDDPRDPDVGVLHLDEPIDLAVYAAVTDVSAAVESGAAVSGVAVVRTEEEPEAPLKTSATFPVSSALPLGYMHGFTTPIFSRGGDSGAGLFLVENGARTHKLIGVARQPEPDRKVDHFTRIDPVVGKWLTDNARDEW